MKQYTEDMDQKLTGNKGPLVYAGIKSIVKSSLGKNVATLLSSVEVCLQNDALVGLSLEIIERGYLKIQKQTISVCVFNIWKLRVYMTVTSRIFQVFLESH